MKIILAIISKEIFRRPILELRLDAMIRSINTENADMLCTTTRSSSDKAWLKQVELWSRALNVVVPDYLTL